MADLITPPTQSIPGPTANYDKVTIKSGGKLVCQTKTNVTIQTLRKK